MDEKSRIDLNTPAASLETAPSLGREVAVRSAIASRGVATRVLGAHPATSLEEMDVAMQHARSGDRVYLDSAVGQHSASVLACSTDEGVLPVDSLVRHAAELPQPHAASDDPLLSASLTLALPPSHYSSRFPGAIIFNHCAVAMGDGPACYGAKATEDMRELPRQPSEADILAIKTQAKAYLQEFYQRECQLKYLFYDFPSISIDQAPQLVLVKEDVQREKESRVLINEKKISEETNDEESEKETNGETSNEEGFLKKIEWYDERLASFEDLHKPKEPVDLKKLFKFKDQKAQSAKRFLIVGRAGIGKTTLSKYIASKYTELWRDQFEWVFYIQLRNLKLKKESGDGKKVFMEYIKKIKGEKLKINLATLIFCECFSDYEEISEQQIDALLGSDKVLLILDGYDELDGDIKEEMLVELLNYQHVILTSRPYSLPDWRIYGYVQLENMGFSNEAIKEYAQKFFRAVGHSEYMQSFLQFLHQHPSAWGIAHIPINLELICSLWEEKKTTHWAMVNPFTLTVLYQDIVFKLFKRYLLKREINPIDRKILKGWSVKKVNQETTHIQLFLETLAYRAMQLPDGNIIIENTVIQQLLDELDSEHPNLLKETLEAQLIKGTGSKIDIIEQDYYFIHLTFQEFFAARAIARILREVEVTDSAYQQLQKLILLHRYNPRFQLVWQFVAGLLTNDIPTLKQFFNILRTEPRDLLENYERYLLVSCLAECKEPKELHLNCDRVLEPLLMVLQDRDEDSDLKRVVIRELSRFGAAVAISNILKTLLNALQDENSWIKAEAAFALGKMGIHAATRDVFEALLVVLQDKDNSEDVILSAGIALGEIGVHAMTQDILKTLLAILQNKKFSVRDAPLFALKEIGAIDVAPAIWDALLAELQDKNEDDEFINAAVLTLNHLGVPPAPDILEKLISIALRDKDEESRISAICILGDIDTIVVTSTVLEALLITLKDESLRVRDAATAVLDKLDTSTVISLVPSLLDALKKDKDSYIRSTAATALGKISCAIVQDDILDALLDALEDEDWHVKDTAIRALEKIGIVVAKKPNILRKLSTILLEEEWFLKERAADTLGSMDIIAATDDVVLDALFKALRNNNGSKLIVPDESIKSTSRDVSSFVLEAKDDLEENSESSSLELPKTSDKSILVPSNSPRCAAANALGKLGLITTKKDVILKELSSALRDSDEWAVKRTIIHALRKMEATTEIPHVLETLLNALQDKKWQVRSEAIEVLEKMDVIATVSHAQILKALLDALQDEKWQVRESAVYAFGKINFIQTVEPKDIDCIFEALLIRLQDEKENVRISAAETLGKMSKIVVTPTVLKKLLFMKQNDEIEIRRLAIMALENIGATTNITILFDLLGKSLSDIKALYIAIATVLTFRFTERRTTIFYDPSVSALCCWEKGALQWVVLSPENCHFFIQQIQKIWIEHTHLPIITQQIFVPTTPIESVSLPSAIPSVVSFSATNPFAALQNPDFTCHIDPSIRIQQIIHQLEENHQQYQQLLLTVGDGSLPFRLWKLRTDIYRLECELWKCLEKSDREKKDFYKKDLASTEVVPLSVMVGGEERFFAVKKAYGDGWCALYAAGIVANEDRHGAQAAIMRLVSEIEHSNPEVMRHIAESLEHNARANALDGGDEAWVVICQEVIRLLQAVNEAEIDTEVYRTALVSFTNYIERSDIQIAYLHYLCRAGYADAGIVSACLSLERKKLVVIYRPSSGCIRTDIDPTANVDDPATVCVIFNGNPNPRLAHYDGLAIQSRASKTMHNYREGTVPDNDVRKDSILGKRKVDAGQSETNMASNEERPNKRVKRTVIPTTSLASTARFLPPPTVAKERTQLPIVIARSREEAEVSELTFSDEQERIQLDYALCLSRMQERGAIAARAAVVEDIVDDGMEIDNLDAKSDAGSSMSTSCS